MKGIEIRERHSLRNLENFKAAKSYTLVESIATKRGTVWVTNSTRFKRGDIDGCIKAVDNFIASNKNTNHRWYVEINF